MPALWKVHCIITIIVNEFGVADRTLHCLQPNMQVIQVADTQYAVLGVMGKGGSSKVIYSLSLNVPLLLGMCCTPETVLGGTQRIFLQYELLSTNLKV